MEDKRITKTKEDLKKAILKIVKEKNINLVTVSELCQKANINRNTFYCHYHYPQEVLEELFDEFIARLMNIFSNGKNSIETIKASCDYIKNNKEISTIFISGNCNGIFENKLNDYIYKRNMKNLETENGPYSSKYYNYISLFLINGSISIIKGWIKNGFKETSDEIATLTASLCNYGTHNKRIV